MTSLSDPIPPRWYIPLGLALLSLLAYLPALQNGFVYDDDAYILKNPLIASLTVDHFVAIITQPYFGNYHPLHQLLIALEHWLFGIDPMGWHALSLLLHAANVALLYGVLIRLGVPVVVSSVGSALFALHPVQAESVAWVSEQKNLLSLLFTLLSLRCYLRWRDSARAAPYLVSLAAFAAALASKVSAVGLVPFLFALELRPPVSVHRRTRGSLLWLCPYLLLAGLWANLAIFHHGRVGFIDQYPGGSLAATVLTMGPVLVEYARNLLWPFGLAAVYDLAPAPAMATEDLLLYWLLAGIGAWLLIRSARREPLGLVLLGLVWIAAFLLPTLNLVPIRTLMNDRYLYAPLCGAGPMAAAGLLAVGRRVLPASRGALIRLVSRGAMAALLLAMAVGSAERSRTWADEERLWRDAAAKSPRNAFARYNLGTLFFEQGRDDLAEPELRAALDADPTLGAPYQNLGAIHLRSGKPALAAREFAAAIALAGDSYDLWMNMALARAATEDDERAISFLRRAAQLRPEEASPYLALGIVLEHAGELERAAEAFRRFLEMAGKEDERRSVAVERIRTLEERNRK